MENSTINTNSEIRKDPHKHKEQYLRWKEKIGNRIPDVSETNSKIILDFIFDNKKFKIIPPSFLV